MITVAFEFLNKIWNNKSLRYILLAFALLVVLVFGWNKVTDNYYQKGIEYQTQFYKNEQDKLAKEYAEKLQEADNKVTATNVELSQLKQDYAVLQEQRKKDQLNTKRERDAYAKTDNGKLVSLNGEWLRLYKTSLPK